ATLERLRHRETGVSRVRERRTSPVTRDELRLRQIGNVEDVETVMPIAHIETISDPQRVVAARRNKIVPWIGFAPGLPLTGDPPARDLRGPRRVGEVEDHRNVADEALHGR